MTREREGDSQEARRNALAVALLPGVICAAIYVLSLRPRESNVVARIEAELSNALASAPAASALEDARERLERTREAVDTERIRVRERESSPRDPAVDSTSGVSAPGARARVTEILLQHRLVLLEEATGASGGDGESLDLGAAAAARRIRLVGEYADVRTAIDRIATDIPSTLVLEVVLEAATAEGGDPTWMLILG